MQLLIAPMVHAYTLEKYKIQACSSYKTNISTNKLKKQKTTKQKMYPKHFFLQTKYLSQNNTNNKNNS